MNAAEIYSRINGGVKMTIEFEKNESDNTGIIRIRGLFNFDANPEFRKALEAGVGSDCKIIVDMSQVDEIDSSALGMLLLLREQCGGNHARIRIVKSKAHILAVLKMANFQNLFDIDALE
jgi:anti-anti-sigma factor